MSEIFTRRTKKVHSVDSSMTYFVTRRQCKEKSLLLFHVDTTILYRRQLYVVQQYKGKVLLPFHGNDG